MGVFVQPPFWFRGYSAFAVPRTETVVVSGPLIEPVSVEEARSHLQMDEALVDQDANILRWITAARQWIEQMTGRALITQTLQDWIDVFPDDDTLTLKRGPVQSIASVTSYTDADVSSVLSSTLYQATLGDPARVVLRMAGYWPSDLRASRAGVVEYVAGYGDNPEDVPEPLRQWILEMVASWYVGREPRKAELLPSYVESYLPATLA